MNLGSTVQATRRSLGLLRSLIIYYAKPFQFQRMARFYRALIGPGDLCFDIGAHVGNRIAVWRRLGATVVAVEPQPGCLTVLRRLYGRDPGVTLVSEAVVGDYRFNWFVGESHRRQRPGWVAAADLIAFLRDLAPDAASGDIFARRADLV